MTSDTFGKRLTAGSTAPAIRHLQKVRVGVVGCGAIARLSHLPAIAASDMVELTALVDADRERASALASQYRTSAILTDYRALRGRVDAAVVALPNRLHAPVSTYLLRHGIHVLVEKPMALNVPECNAMIEAAARANAVLAVGLDFRFFQACRLVKRLLSQQWLGEIKGFDLELGIISKWPVSSDYPFRKETAGGGVLMAYGVHLLDLVLWWLGTWNSVEYYDDAMGGVEAECELRLQFESGSFGLLKISRIRDLRNTCVVYGTQGTLEVGLWDHNPLIKIQFHDQESELRGEVHGLTADRTLQDVFRRQIEDFARAIRTGQPPFVSGCEGRRSMELIDACYATRKHLETPWMFPERLA